MSWLLWCFYIGNNVKQPIQSNRIFGLLSKTGAALWQPGPQGLQGGQRIKPQPAHVTHQMEM